MLTWVMYHRAPKEGSDDRSLTGIVLLTRLCRIQRGLDLRIDDRPIHVDVPGDSSKSESALGLAKL